MSDQYLIQVTAGTSYDPSDHAVVRINDPTPLKISSSKADIELNIRVKDFSGLPLDCAKTSPYFDVEPHLTADNTYSIAFHFTPKQPEDQKPAQSATSPVETDISENEGEETGISAVDLQFGNDLDHSVKDRLPPGFNSALTILRWWVDPGLEGDAYADRPYLYGPALSSMSTVYVGKGRHDPEMGGFWFEEGGDDEGQNYRREVGAPDAAKDRKKWALQNYNKEKWTFEYGKTYSFDFFNPYFDFPSLSVRLPGFPIPVMKYWDGQKASGSNVTPSPRSHACRYVLRNRKTEQVYLVIVFSLYPIELVNEDGSLKPEAHHDRVETSPAGQKDISVEENPDAVD